MKGLVSWISLDVHVRFNQTQPYLINGSGEGMRANQDCTNPWYKNHCWAVGMRNDHMSQSFFSFSFLFTLLGLAIIHEFQGRGAILTRKYHTLKDYTCNYR